MLPFSYVADLLYILERLLAASGEVELVSRCLTFLLRVHHGQIVTNGVLAPIVGVVGSIQATEAIKSLTGVGTTLVGRLLIFDGLNMQFREIKIKPNPACPTCGT